MIEQKQEPRVVEVEKLKAHLLKMRTPGGFRRKQYAAGYNDAIKSLLLALEAGEIK